MNTREFHPKRSINYRTNHDILFNIMIKLDVQHIILLWFAAKNSKEKYWKNKDNIANVLKKHFFWQENARSHLQSQQLFSVTNFQKLMLDRYDAYNLIENKLDNSIYYEKSLFYFLTGAYDGLPDITIKEIGNFLIKDDAEGLFHKIVAIPNLLPLIKKDDYDVNGIQACVGHNLVEEDLQFVGLFTCMMQLSAINCFDLFSRTLIILHASVPTFVNAISEKYSIRFLWNSLSTNIDFHKHFINLIIKLYSNPARSINYALDAGYFDLLRDSFNSMSKERLNYLLDHCEQWQPPVSKSTLMMFCTETEYKKNLSENAMKTISIKIDEKNLNESINELINLRSKMSDIYGQWIQELRDRETLQNRSQNSYGIRPK